MKKSVFSGLMLALSVAVIGCDTDVKKVSSPEPVKPETLVKVETQSKKRPNKGPRMYVRCKMCHSMPGDGGKIGPDLLLSKMTEDEWARQTLEGSNWEGRPPKMVKYDKKNMPKQRVTKAEAIDIYSWVQSLKAEG